MSPSSLVGIETRYGLEDPGFETREARKFSSPKPYSPGLGSTQAFYLGIKAARV
jgi:hypothetical protein